jgi:DNA-binding NarL/FixJ family response regulator
VGAREGARVVGRFARALIVDEQAGVRGPLVALLRARAEDVLEASSVVEAKRMLALRPDLVIVDVRLPDGSGRELAIVASRIVPRPLIVAMSHLPSASEAFSLAQCGVRVYLTKPLVEQEFTDAIEELLACPAPQDVGPLPQVPSALGSDLEASIERFAHRYSATDREMALVRLTIAGVPRRRCPVLLNVSENTCKTLARRLLQRCGARNLAEIPRLVLLR